MECGSQGAFCELASWLTQNDLLAPWLVEVISRFGVQANGLVGQIAQLVQQYGQTLVGLVGVSFGIWRWWRYREHILHRRLAEYLRESDARLTAGTADLVQLIQRPAPGQQLKDPLFANNDLRTVLRERNWDNEQFALGVEKSSDWQLVKAIRSIERRLKTAHDQMTSLHLQLASAHSIRGAIASSQARRNRSDAAHARALEHFRSARSVPGSESNPLLLELEAHQQRKLGLSTAEVAYQELCADDPINAPREAESRGDSAGEKPSKCVADGNSSRRSDALLPRHSARVEPVRTLGRMGAIGEGAYPLLRRTLRARAGIHSRRAHSFGRGRSGV
jgi:hypothetical protein